MLIANVRLQQGSMPTDLRIGHGRVSIQPAGAPAGTSERIDADGRYALPGLWDAHVHFEQWASARRRIDLSGTTSAAEVAALLAEHVRSRTTPHDDVLVGYGFRDGLWPDTPTAELLDSAIATQPAVMISGDLHAGWLNTAAMHRFGVADHPTGLLREQEWMPISDRVGGGASEAVVDSWVEQAAQQAAARGVVGVVDFELPDNSTSWTRRIAAGQRTLRVVTSVWPQRLDEAIARGHRSGDPLPDTDGLAVMGPLKVITDGSLNTRTAYCHDPYPALSTGPSTTGVLSVPFDELVQLLDRAKSAGLTAAVHAIGNAANHLALDAFEQVGIAGTIEHAQLLDNSDFSRFQALGVVASVQPEHAVDDRDVADRWWPGHTRNSFAYGSLAAAGAALAFGSDAPVAPLDPWVAIAAAVHRSADDRPPWHPEQHISLAAALLASTRGRDRIRDGDIADLVLVDADPFTADPAALRSMPVGATVLGGRFTHRSSL